MTIQSAATLRSRYVEQAASDLEEVRRQQQELTETIRVLQQEEALLVDILSLAERAPSAEAPALPEQAQGEPATATTRSSAVDAATRGAQERTVGPSTSRGDADGATAGRKGRQPLLGDLLMQLLGAHDEPRLSKELRDELMDKYPDRTPTPQVVRNTLESLVAKSRIRRHRQQRSVVYSLALSAQPATAKG